jgi:hypothetical protein
LHPPIHDLSLMADFQIQVGLRSEKQLVCRQPGTQVEAARFVAARNQRVHVLAVGYSVIDRCLGAPQIVRGTKVICGRRRIEIGGRIVIAAGVTLAAQPYGPSRPLSQLAIQLPVDRAIT